jgi:2-phospho-L-lactate guanylyltransferase
VKFTGECKQRLSPILSPDRRLDLVRAMFLDVLTACVESKVFDAAWVCCAGDTKYVPRDLGAWTVQDNEGKGMKHAVDKLIPLARSFGITHLLVIPADIPRIRPEDFRTMWRTLTEENVQAVIVPSRDGTGTNAVFCTPPDLFPMAFEGKSLERNLQTLNEKKIRYASLNLPTLALDVDTPADLAEYRKLNDGKSLTSAVVRDLSWDE